MNVIRTPAGKLRRRAAIGAVGLAALGGGGAAVAASQGSATTPQAQTQAIAADAADQLGVTTAALTAAIKKAMVDQIEAQVTAGKLTKAQATALEARLAKADAPLFALGGGPAAPATTASRRARRRSHRVRRGRDLHRRDDHRAAHAARRRQDARDHRHRQRQDRRRPQGRAHDRGQDGSRRGGHGGRLTQAQADKILAALPARLDHEINEAHTGGHGSAARAARRRRTLPANGSTR